MRLKLKTKVVLLAVISALLPVLVILGLTLAQKKKITQEVSKEVYALARMNMAQIVSDVYSMCESSFELMRGRLEQGVEAVNVLLARGGGINLGTETVAWEMKYPDGTVSNMTLPVLLFEDKPFVRNSDFAVKSVFVDDVKDLSGLICSVFQRINERGDMLRVASTVVTPDGSRAVATVLTATRADGAADPVVAAVLAGQMYRGLNPTLGNMFLTAYVPLRDTNGKVIGMLGVGWKMDAGNSLVRAIRSIKVGKTGYVSVTGGKGALQGVYVISKDGLRDGENILQEKDNAGRFFIREIIEKAIARPAGEIQFDRYPWMNKGETAPRMKIAAYTYFDVWDWVIVAGAYEDDYFSAWDQIDILLEQQGRFFVYCGSLVLLLAILFAIFIGIQITRPLRSLNAVASQIADGDLAGASKKLNDMGYSDAACGVAARLDEAGQLACAFKKMAQALSSLVGQVQRSGIQVTTSTTQIAASARQLEATVTEQAASTNQVTATTKEITLTAQHLVQTMESVATGAVETASLAGASQTSLQGMEATMRQLMEATGSISSRLSTISEKANNIESIVTTITKVADQTNLLSLNAAIEAEKAGEYGLGFSVVAQEIRRLADQTAVATLNIENMVKDMHSAVSAGVMEMDKFIDQVRRGVQEVGKIGERMGGIIGQVQTLTPQFEQVRQGMQTQSEGAEQISHAMMQLSEAAGQTKTSLQEFNRAATQLTSAVQDLRQEVTKFKAE